MLLHVLYVHMYTRTADRGRKKKRRLHDNIKKANEPKTTKVMTLDEMISARAFFAPSFVRRKPHVRPIPFWQSSSSIEEISLFTAKRPPPRSPEACSYFCIGQRAPKKKKKRFCVFYPIGGRTIACNTLFVSITSIFETVYLCVFFGFCYEFAKTLHLNTTRLQWKVFVLYYNISFVTTIVFRQKIVIIFGFEMQISAEERQEIANRVFFSNNGTSKSVVTVRRVLLDFVQRLYARVTTRIDILIRFFERKEKGKKILAIYSYLSYPFWRELVKIK